jgi:hypothetical protein
MRAYIKDGRRGGKGRWRSNGAGVCEAALVEVDKKTVVL